VGQSCVRMVVSWEWSAPHLECHRACDFSSSVLIHNKGPGYAFACLSGSLPRCVVCCRGSAVLSGAFLLEEGLVHKGVVTANHFERLLLGTFHDEAAHDHFFQDEVRLVEVENQVQFAHVTEVAVEYLYEVVDDVQHDQFVVRLLNARHEVQRRVPV